MELEYKRRNDIYDAVRDYVVQSVDSGAKLPAEEFIAERFSKDEGKTMDILTRRTGDIVSSLHEGNHIAYGINRKLFDIYEKLEETPKPKL